MASHSRPRGSQPPPPGAPGRPDRDAVTPKEGEDRSGERSRRQGSTEQVPLELSLSLSVSQVNPHSDSGRWVPFAPPRQRQASWRRGVGG